jgi:hypothetical protein
MHQKLGSESKVKLLAVLFACYMLYHDRVADAAAFACAFSHSLLNLLEQSPPLGTEFI